MTPSVKEATRFLVVCAIASVLPASALAYETLGSLPEFGGTERVAWSSTTIPYRVHMWGAPGPFVEEVITDAELAFNTWEAIGCASVDFTYDGLSDGPAVAEDGHNDLYWVRDPAAWSALGLSEDALAVTDLSFARRPDGTFQIVEADILLEGVRRQWSTMEGEPNPALPYVRAVLTHEAGHVLGLRHVCEQTAIDGLPACSSLADAESRMMFPDYLGPSQLALSSDDEEGFCFLYAPVVNACDPCPTGFICVDGECVDPCLSCPAETTCVAGRCVNRCAACPVDSVCVDGDCVPVPECVPDSRPCNVGVCSIAGDNVGSCIEEGAVGAPCTGGERCASSACASGGYCVAECADDGECPEGHECVATDGGGRECVPTSPPRACSAAPGRATTFAECGLVLAALLGWTVLRRRRRSAP